MEKANSNNKVSVKSKFSGKLATIMAVAGIRENRSGGKSNRLCIFCNGEHYNDECRSCPDRIARIEKVLKLNLCEKCLRKGHSKAECGTAMKPCFYCKEGYHLRCLCPVEFE